MVTIGKKALYEMKSLIEELGEDITILDQFEISDDPNFNEYWGNLGSAGDYYSLLDNLRYRVLNKSGVECPTCSCSIFQPGEVPDGEYGCYHCTCGTDIFYGPSGAVSGFSIVTWQHKSTTAKIAIQQMAINYDHLLDVRISFREWGGKELVRLEEIAGIKVCDECGRTI